MIVRHALALVAILATVAGTAQAQVAQEDAVAVASFPHDPDAFTQGLFIHDNTLYESTGRVGASSLRRVDLETGAVEQATDIEPPYFGEGSVRLGDRIFMLTWQAQTGFVYDAGTLERTGTFAYSGEGWGLTHDGQALILSDGSSTLRRIDPDDFSTIGTIEVTLGGRPVRRLNELEWVDGEIWANVWMTPMIVRIDPDSGHVTGLVNLTSVIPAGLEHSREAVPNGIAWNAQTGQVFVTGKLWPVLYEISLPQSAGTDE